MEFVKDPIKARKVFIGLIIGAIVLFVAAGTLGYLFYQKNKAYKNLESEKNQLQENTQISVSDLENLQKENEELKKQVSNWEENAAQAKTYTAVLTYFGEIVNKHGGFEGWSEAEYQEGRRLAQATGNSSFVALVDWLWEHEEVDPMTRMVRFLNGIVTGINNNLE